MRSRYSGAICACSFLEFILVLGIFVGIILATVGFFSGDMFSFRGNNFGRHMPMMFRIYAAAPGLGIALGCLYFYVQTVSVRATIHSAETNEQMARGQGETEALLKKFLLEAKTDHRHGKSEVSDRSTPTSVIY